MTAPDITISRVQHFTEFGEPDFVTYDIAASIDTKLEYSPLGRLQLQDFRSLVQLYQALFEYIRCHRHEAEISTDEMRQLVQDEFDEEDEDEEDNDQEGNDSEPVSD